ncbi:YncE family protein [Kribbella sp. GL6]|uniref:YncE family protein n=1 Tax=Kribbella sp. GL6 TaxID=3419765 RepID=UPI003D00E8CC
MKRAVALSMVLLLAAGGCSGNNHTDISTTPAPSSTLVPTQGPHVTPAAKNTLLPGMPRPLSPTDVWAADRPGMFAASVRRFPERIYVPNSGSNTVTEIDPRTYKVIRTFRTGREPQHVVPSWDLKTLWVNNDLGNSLTPINPLTGIPGKAVAVHDPYNLYFTPDGKHAVVMASNDKQLVFRDPHTMAVQKTVPVPCAGVNHADFTADGTSFLVSCEFSADLLVVDTAAEKVTQVVHLPMRRRMGMPMPQDVKLSPNGRFYFVADMVSNGIWVLNARPPVAIKAFIPTGKGAHGLYVTRNSRYLLITNRGEGSISLLDFRTRKVVRKIKITGGGSPDMGGLSPDGLVFWVSGRYNSVVYAIRLSDGKLLAKIRVGKGPHGLAVYPQPGRYSLGHTGVFR